MNSLPISWNISNYSEEELKGIKFVLDFINNENKLNHKEGFDLDGFTASQ